MEGSILIEGGIPWLCFEKCMIYTHALCLPISFICTLLSNYYSLASLICKIRIDPSFVELSHHTLIGSSSHEWSLYFQQLAYLK